MNKYAVLAMDLEDWFHLDYFLDKVCDRSQSTLDGLIIYLEILKKFEIKTTFFVVGELIERIPELIQKILDDGHELALHSYSHKRPLTMTLNEFEEDTIKSILLLQKHFSYKVKGFRAPCFSMDRDRLEILRNNGLIYDASKIAFLNHELYGDLDLKNFSKIGQDIFVSEKFYEFETTTVDFFGKPVPISGGGYLRIFPWIFTSYLLNKLVKSEKNYFFYIHPFEFSRNFTLTYPTNTTFITKLRFNLGRKSVKNKFIRLLKLLEKNGYKFVKFEELLEIQDGK